MSDVRDPGPVIVDKILRDLEDLVSPPTEVARQARRLRAHIEGLRGAREAFLDLIADAVEFKEEPDGDEGGDYTRYIIITGWQQLERLAEAFGIRRRFDESTGDAIKRAIDESSGEEIDDRTHGSAAG